MDKKKLLKIASVVVTVAGAGLGLISEFLDDKVTEMELDEKLAEYLEKKGLNV